ncbi:MAG: MFS transporter [Clostridiales Family XIII bacterium]|jgi:FSR family fosmidomycin resistance protein-like MFS transporter|nr:MFS transporter [Clostridiales Family XIII bacterium]
MKTKRYSYLLLMGHISTDINQGALPALLPFLIAEHGLSYTSAAGLVFASNLVSSVVQPLFGHLGDKMENPKLMCLGVLLASGGISFMGFFDNYWALFFSAMATGVGVALFHPEASKLAAYVSGEKKGEGMSIFAVGGNIGFAVGPVVCSALMLGLGMRGTAVFVCQGAAVAAILLMKVKAIHSAAMVQKTVAEEQAGDGRKDNWPAFTLVSLSMFCRAIVGTCLNTFVPLFWVYVLAQSVASGNVHLTVLAASGAIATLLGGRLADRIGFKRIIMICSISAVPLLFLFTFNRSPLVATVLIALVGLAMSGCHSTLVVMGQSFLPNRLGLASGVLYGLTVSVGGIAAPGVGMIADNFGIPSALLVLSVIGVLALVFSSLIPRLPGDGISGR